MSKTAMIRARMEPKLKADVESLFARLGLTASDAINIFYRQVKMRKGLPFDVEVPNRKTRSVMKATDDGKNLVRARDKQDLFNKLGL